ncbi:hypothetical protein ACFWZ2_40025 [Streptomyces sp. NPDC059002]|uniref:hypothetical protein n=1 Tax=Streptomyces sp. NPDC059002 TaxID=3346690 RepID=UPI0036BB10A2
MPHNRRTRCLLAAAAAVVLAATTAAAYPDHTPHPPSAVITPNDPGAGIHKLIRDQIDIDLDDDHRHH